MEIKYRKDGRRLVIHGSYDHYYSSWVYLYNHGRTMTDIANEYGTTLGSVKYCLELNNIPIRSNIKYVHLYQEWKLKYDSGLTLSEIAEEYNTDSTVVHYGLKRVNTKMRPTNSSNDHINHNYFSIIDDELKAYYLGILYSDGSITGGNKPHLYLELSYPDEYIVEHLANILNTNTYKRVREGRSPSTRINLSSKPIAEDLYKHCIIPNKTYSNKFNLTTSVPEDYIRHSIRGLIDGDGGVKFKMIGNTCKKSVHFCGCLCAVQGLVSIIGNLTHTYPSITKDRNIYKTEWSGYEDVKMIYDYLYTDATMWMSRKRHAMWQIVQTGIDRGYINI